MFKIRSAPAPKLLILLLLATLLGIFWLPYHVPVQPTLSDSYVVGFNNRVAWLCLLLLMGICLFVPPPVARQPTRRRQLSRSTLYKAATITFFWALFMFLVVRAINSYGEEDFFIDRLRLVLGGKVPYRDFEYPYGAGLLYLPAALSRFTHLGATDAYGAIYVLACTAGVVLLWASLRWMDGSGEARRSLFLFVWVNSLVFNLSVGIHYSLLRFDFPIFWILLIHRMVLRKDAAALSPFLLTVLGYALMLLISPELAVALGIGSLLYLPVAGRLRSSKDALAYTLTMAALAGISAWALKLGVFRTMLAFRAGAGNFPVMPAPHIWLFLLAAGAAACSAGALLRSSQNGTALPLFCFALLASAAAFGRCDPGHVLLNGLPLILCAGVVLTEARLPWRGYLWLLWLNYIIYPILPVLPKLPKTLARTALPSIFALEHSDRLTRFDLWVLHRMQRKNGAAVEGEFAAYRAVARREPLNLPLIFGQPPGTVFAVPYSFFQDIAGRYHEDGLDEGYFIGMVDVGTPEQVRDKVRELSDNPERLLLLPLGMGAACPTVVDNQSVFLSQLFMFPYRVQMRHPENLALPLCRYIEDHYRRIAPPDPPPVHYALWVPKR